MLIDFDIKVFFLQDFLKIGVRAKKKLDNRL